MENLAAIALEAASRVHQRASGSASAYTAGDQRVLDTADVFYKWLRDKSL